MAHRVNYCATCGAALIPRSSFCSSCGTSVTVATTVTPDASAPVTPPPTQLATPPPDRETPPPSAATASSTPPNRWWIIPAVLGALVIIAWLVLAHLPFGSDGGDITRRQPPAVDTVAEAPPPPQSATIVDVTAAAARTETARRRTEAPRPQAARVSQRTVAAAQDRQTVSAHTAAPRSAPVTKIPVAVVRPLPPPATHGPAQRGEISGAEAQAVLRQYVASSNYYRVPGDCLRVDNDGYRNVGYTLDVWDRCNAGGNSRMLGRWRVDAKTGEVFRQRGDGRFTRP